MLSTLIFHNNHANKLLAHWQIQKKNQSSKNFSFIRNEFFDIFNSHEFLLELSNI